MAIYAERHAPITYIYSEKEQDSDTCPDTTNPTSF